VGWTAGVVALMAVYGGLLEVAVEAIMSTPALTAFLVEAESLVEAIAQMLVAFAGFLGGGFALQTFSGLRAEETSGRLELALTVGRHRWFWLAAHAAVGLDLQRGRVAGSRGGRLRGPVGGALRAGPTTAAPGVGAVRARRIGGVPAT